MSWQCLGPCPRGTQEYLYLPSMQEPLLAQGPALAPRENLGLWPCISSLYSELPSPALCYPLSFWMVPQEPLPDTQRPCHI